jgi:Zn-dependent protease with chaperone function
MALKPTLLPILLAGLSLAAAGPPSLRAQAPATQQPPEQRQAPEQQQAPEPHQAQSASAQPAPRQAYSLPPDKLAQAIALSRIRNLLDIADSLGGIALLWLLLATRASARCEAWLQRLTPRRWLQGLLFFALYFIVTTAAALPLGLIGHHFERSYQISVQGWASWFGDVGKDLALTLAIGAPLLLFFHWIVRRWPRRYWLGAWVATLPILAITVFVAPYVAVLYDQFEPLSKDHPALVQKLETIVARTGIDIPPDRMYLMKASAKTNGPNAYVTGLGASKRYVMWDTVTDRMPDDEVLFIFGHESGHYVLHHLPKGIAISAVALFFVYWACAACAAWLMRRRGPRWGALNPAHLAGSSLLPIAPERAAGPSAAEAALASRTGFVALLFIAAVAGFLLEPISNGISRHFEHQADVYGQEALHGIVPDPQKTAVAAFNDLGRAWLDAPHPNPLIEFWLYNHPSTQHRAQFAQHYDPWANGGHGEFFAN